MLRSRISGRSRARACCIALITMAWALPGCQKAADTVDAGTAQAGDFRQDQSVEAAHTRGVALMGQFDYGAAHDVFEQLAQSYPEWDDVRVDLAIAKLNRREGNDAEDAAEILEDVVQSSSDNLRAKYCRAILMFYNGQIEAALALFESVASADPDDAYAAYFAGQCLFDLGRFEEALQRFTRAQENDPYLRSANYGAFQTLQRLNQAEAAAEQLALFQKLADNPQARSAEIKYSRMGPKAEARTLASWQPPSVQRPTGALFETPKPLTLSSEADLTWAEFDASGAAATTVCDINGDASLDLFINGAITVNDERLNAVILRSANGWTVHPDHPLAAIQQVNATLWGDINNDGLVDVYFCRNGPNQLWQQAEDESWQDVTATAATDGGDFETVDGAMIDADHDGDLDLFLVQRNGKNELLNNNLDGTFSAIAAEQGIAGDGRASIGLAVADFDHDRDADILVIKASAPHALYLNDRLWNYTEASTLDEKPFAALLNAPIAAAVAVDTDADGQVEIVTVSTAGANRWSPDENGRWQAAPFAARATQALSGPIAVQDLDGDGRHELVATEVNAAWLVQWATDPPASSSANSSDPLGPFALAALEPSKGLSVVTAVSGQPPLLWQPGPGRFPFAAIDFTGKDSKADQMRSNASGIGVQAAARSQGRWTALQTFRTQSGPGQSHQPVTIGLGGAPSIDYLHLVWPDGLFQTELGLAAGEVHQVEETQRQVSSCPVLFVWDGTQFRFVSDILGVGGLGFNHDRGNYHPPRPWENFLLPADLPVRHAGRFALKIGEPMEETCYLDAARLVAYDIPRGWQMTMDERQSVAEPLATGKPIFYRETIQPIAITDHHGQDVRTRLAEADGVPLNPGNRDRRFLARTEPFSVRLRFAAPITDREGSGTSRPVLVIDGWIEYPYSQTTFAAWQAGADYDAPTLEARSRGGSWKCVYKGFGYPAGMPRQMSLPINVADLPPGTVELRLSTNMEIYWDRILLAVEEPCPDVTTHRCPLVSAQAQEVGFPRRTDNQVRRPRYEYEVRAPLWDTRHHSGFFTEFGDVLALVADVDDAVVAFGPGEETHLEFAADLPQLAPDRHRRFVLECNGWCKDMDLYTQHGDTLTPLPQRDNVQRTDEQESRREELHRKFLRRFRAG